MAPADKKQVLQKSAVLSNASLILIFLIYIILSEIPFTVYSLVIMIVLPAIKRHNEVEADLNAVKYVNKDYLIDGLRRISETDKIPEKYILYPAFPFYWIPQGSIYQW